ncbi:MULTISPECIES: glucose 1-dehydrogenase [unclassified Imperialibacter]|uniref:glucose 1-dehydrogenase n=1 Tax=unclassified Imperialibacter TaxID=2629706 RepID=UPI00125B2340|nr:MULTISPECIES: glucose 1-dehydrogenase [unclassified Imperialibacter]CAD5278163.1 NAD(P)-dependent dehydrogenase, short-chain alcohol dehydrogenase family [Imperialibacter sp. 75]CAD5295921.1 NAD(P)-dependent dehydrogenase, short-chain alcohol dehydrogenase family [Imperialibacter sp. 89]VVT11655.1 NAD(P)-dependent dehydrogenase, short-chain alcohol dehydrogenase family [Imperialibacter sp. EC-SDR9]
MTIQEKFRLDGKVAVITGASKGIGEAMALALGQAGAKVVVSSRKQDPVNEVAKKLKAEGIEAIGVAANAGEKADLENLLKATEKAFGGVDIIINNAATNPVFGPVVQTDEAAFDKIMQVNVKGPFMLSKLAFPIMKQRGGGSIINISSIEGLSPEPFMGMYAVSKAALISLTKVFAREWGATGIRANVICPGLIQTKFSQGLWANEAILNKIVKELPIARVGQTDEMAGLALYLASEASSYTTGGVFVADGGYTI